MRFVLVGDDFPAERTLKLLQEFDQAEITAVYTSLNAKRPTKLQSLAEKSGIPVFAAKQLKKAAGLEQLAGQPFDWLININSTVIIPNEILALPTAGALNMHPGVLPAYAGLHTHQWAIRNGEKEFGATIHFMEAKVDVGDIVAQQTFLIAPEDTGMSLFLKCIKTGTQIMREVIQKIMAGDVLPQTTQDLNKTHLYRHRDALEGQINWQLPAAEIERFVRAGSYYPFASPTYTASFNLDGKIYSVVKVDIIEHTKSLSPGETFWDKGLNTLVVGCGENTTLHLIHLNQQNEKSLLAIDILQALFPDGAQLGGLSHGTE
jgi:methionyl-tRNA formyltransferase